LIPFWACLATPRAAWLAPTHDEDERNSTPGGSSAERIFCEVSFVNFEFFFIG
jgi:hypothetical protein